MITIRGLEELETVIEASLEIKLIHNKEVFNAARKIFYENSNQREKMLPVSNKVGEVIYYLKWEANQVDPVHYVEDFWEYDINDSHLDYELLDRGEVYFFLTFEEYTYQIACIVLAKYPEKDIFFLDNKAKLFFDETTHLHIISSIADIYNNYKKCISQTILTIDSKKEFLDNPMRFIIKRYRSLSVMTSLFWKRNVVSFGEKNPDKIFYVIKDSLGGSGLGDMIRRAFLKMAMVMGKPDNFIPVIDFSVEGDKNQFTGGNGENAWTLFFEQITEVPLEEVYESKNVIISSHEGWDVFNPYYLEQNCFMDRKAMYREYLRIKGDVKRYIEELYRQVIPNSYNRILGVIGRGTDYRSNKSVGTPKPIEADIFLQEVRKALADWNCDYIFLATEDEAVYKVFMKSDLKEKIFVVDQERIDYEDENNKDLFLYEIKMRDHKNGYYDSLKYLGIIYILSRCTCLISTCYCGAWECAVGMNDGKYERIKRF